MMVIVQTLPEVENEQGLQLTIRELRALLDEDGEQEPKSKSYSKERVNSSLT
jgi:hypothetical protein